LSSVFQNVQSVTAIDDLLNQIEYCLVYIFFAVNRSNVSEVVAASNVILQFLLARLRQQHEHCTITKVRLATII